MVCVKYAIATCMFEFSFQVSSKESSIDEEVAKLIDSLTKNDCKGLHGQMFEF